MKTVWILILGTLASPHSFASEETKGLFDNPLGLFQTALVPALSHSVQAKIQTTLRGFNLRADDESAFKDETSPSKSGIYLTLQVRDSEEIPKFSDSTEKQTNGFCRTIKFPAPDKEAPQGLLIILTYGSQADPAALTPIEECIAEIERKLGVKK